MVSHFIQYPNCLSMVKWQYNKIKDIAYKTQAIEMQILEYEKRLEIAKLEDEPFEIFKLITHTLETLKIKKELAFFF